MKMKIAQFAFAVLAFSFLTMSADSVMAQKKGGYWGNDKQARKEYRKEVKETRKEYRRDVREARREYKEDRKENRRYSRASTRPPYGRAYGYYNVRPYRGANRRFYRGRLPQNRNSVSRNRRWR